MEIAYILLLTLGAGLCIPLGGLLARVERIGPRWLESEFRHFMIALGGGLLLGAVFEVLLPQGIARFDSPSHGVLVFVAGGLLFFAIERTLGLRRRENPQLLGMLLDYLPESIALGGLVATDPSLALVLAIVIGAQNIPEGFNAYREIVGGHPGRSAGALRFMLFLVPIGPIGAILAHVFLREQDAVLGTIMLLGAGGIMYLMFQDIAPQSRLKNHWAPPLGGVLGFAITLLTALWIDHP